MTPHLIPITNDLYDVASRLTSVKATYVVYYNKLKCRYEVYDGDNFAFVVPYGELDCRTIDYALKTSVQNADEIFEEIRRNNDYVTKKTISNAVDEAAYKIKNKEVK